MWSAGGDASTTIFVAIGVEWGQYCVSGIARWSGVLLLRAMLLGCVLFALPASQSSHVSKLVLLVHLRDPLNQNFDIRIPAARGGALRCKGSERSGEKRRFGDPPDPNCRQLSTDSDRIGVGIGTEPRQWHHEF